MREEAREKSFKCMDVQIGGPVLFYKTANRKGSPRWRGPAKILDIDEAVVAVKFQSQTFKVAWYRARKTAEEKDAEEGGWNTTSTRPRPMESEP